MAIFFHNQECDYLPQNRRRISHWISETVRNEGYRIGEINYIFCSSEDHIEINRKYLGHDYNTDVITFDYSTLEGLRVVSGDIFIDPFTVINNAKIWKTKPAEEELRVIVHGVLHLCGYNDKSKEEAKIMREKENFYLWCFK